MEDVTLRLTLQDDVCGKLTRVTSSARSTSSVLQQMGQRIDNAFRTNSPEQFASSLGSAMDSASDDADNLGNSLEDAMRQLDNASDFDISSGMDSAADSASDLADAADTAGRAIEESVDSSEELGDAVGDIGGGDGLDELGESADESGESMEEASGKAMSLGDALKSLFMIAAGAKVLKEVKDFVGDCVDLGKEYTSMMSEVQAISGASGSEMEMLESTARQYGATTVFSATEAAEALKYMSLAGWDAQQSASALGGVLNLAAASGMELGQASDMVTDYLTAFGMEASQAGYMADMLAYAQSHSNTTAEQLGEAYRNSAANLNAAGQDIETTTSLLEAMANQGYKGSEAGTALSAIMRDITNNMEDGAIKIGDTSVSVQDAQGNFRDLTDILTDVEAATNGMGDAERAAALGSTFTADSTKGLNLILAEGMEKISGYEEALRGADGAAGDMANTMNDNLAGDMANMNSAFEEMKLQVFEGLEEPLRDAVQFITSDVLPALSEFAPEMISSAASALGKLANGLKPLMNFALQNPEKIGAGLASIATGMLAFKAVNTGNAITKSLSGVTSLTGALTKLAPALFSNPWALGAAAVVGALSAIGLAVHEYNKMQIEDSLSEHFGNIELTAAQIKAAAGQIIDAKYLVNITGALNSFKNADELAKQAEEALAKNDALEWKCSIGMTLNEDEISGYIANVDDFISSSVKELEDRTYAATITIDTMIGDTEEGKSLVEQMNQWAIEDQSALDGLSERLSNLVQKALEDGVIDVNEQAAIDILQTKINNILSSWKESDALAEMDLTAQKYGKTSGQQLSPTTFVSLVEELGSQRESALEAVDEASKETYSVLNGMLNSGRITADESEHFKDLISQAARNMEAGTVANSVNFETDTISGAYGDLLNENFETMESNTNSFLERVNGMWQDQDLNGLFGSLQYAYNNAMVGTGLMSSEDQKALSDIYENLKPDATAMQDLISEYQEVGQAIPQELMDSFNQAMEIGAAAGDADAAWQVFANKMVADPASKALVDAIQEGTVTVPEELKNALDIALAETTDEPLEMNNVSVGLAGMDLDVAQVAEMAGMTVEEVEEIFNELGIPIETEVDADVTAGEVNADGVGEAIQDAAESATSGIDGTTEVTIDATATAGTVDTAGAEQQISAAVTDNTSVAPVSTTAEASVGVDATVDTSGVADVGTEVDSAVKNAVADSYEDTTSVNVTATLGTDNFATVASEAASKMQSAITSAFAKTFTATSNVAVTLNYSVVNPSHTFTISGGGSGSVTVSAHALGGIFDTPHYGVFAEAGPEAFIPIDGSDNAKSIWEETGRMLGMFGGNSARSVSPVDSIQRISSDSDGKTQSEKTINLNINGQGAMSFKSGNGVSKESVVDIMMANIKDVFMNIVQEEIIEEGVGAYEY